MEPSKLRAAPATRWILPVAVALSAAIPAWAAGLVFEQRHARFADRYQGDTVVERYAFTNTGATTIAVIDTFVVDGTGEIEVLPRTLAPGASGVATVRQPLLRQLGSSAFRYALITDEPDTDRYRFTLSGFVQSAYDPETPSLDFDVVDRSLGATADVELASREVLTLAVTPPRDLPEAMTVQVLPSRAGAGQARILRARLPPGGAPGLVSGSFLVETNVPAQPRVRIYYRANVVGDVVPGENPVQLGITRIGEALVKQIRLESRSGSPFRVEDVVDPVAGFRWEVAPCAEGGGDACQNLILRLEPLAPVNLVGQLRVHLAEEDDPITLSYRGMVIAKDTIIKTLTAPEPAVSEDPER